MDSRLDRRQALYAGVGRTNADGQHEIGGVAYGGGTVYLADQQAGLLALDPLTGHRRWAAPIRGTATAVALQGGVVYLSSLTSADASTGPRLTTSFGARPELLRSVAATRFIRQAEALLTASA